MKERLFIFGGLGLLVILLVGLNTASYVQKETIPDSEAVPNRSTYNTGPTGTRAFHDLLVSTGQKVMRWEKPVNELNLNLDNGVSTLVIIGQTRRNILPVEMEQLLEWVAKGRALVIIDRKPPAQFLKTTNGWRIKHSVISDDFSADELSVLLRTVDPSNPTQMTGDEEAAKPFQPTVFTAGVNAIQPSKFAATFSMERAEDTAVKSDAPLKTQDIKVKNNEGKGGAGEPTNTNSAPNENIGNSAQNGNIGVGVGDAPAQSPSEELPEYYMSAPVIHFGNKKKNILIEYTYGLGNITLISDPYLISNGGVVLVDNAQMGINALSMPGIVAFDEYHQGYGSDRNRLISYFTGTPVVPIFLQLLLLAGLIVFSKSRRFARPLSLHVPSRISKLEYISAMAQVKRRTKAYDLAIENIYTDFRRRASRLTGVDNHKTHNSELAAAIAKRTEYTPREIIELMEKCENIAHGETTNKKEVLAVSSKIREVENALGLRRGRTAFPK